MKVAKIYLNSITKEIEKKEGVYCFAEIVEEVKKDTTDKLKVNDVTYKVNIIPPNYTGIIDKYLEESNIEVLKGDQIKSCNIRKIKEFVHDHTVNRKERELNEV